MATPTAPKALRDKFSTDKATYGGITCLTLHGTLNVEFEGKKLAEGIRTKAVVVSLRHVSRFASWGMSEWMDFLRITADRDLYLVECSSYALSQINLITGLLGHAKLVSYYASFRCGSCSEELDTLFIIPKDREVIRDLPGNYRECPACGGNARLEEYPAAFFETIADRPAFDIDDEVLGFLRSHYRYDITPDVTRFRAYRSARNGYSYLRLSGSVSALPVDVLAKSTEGTAVVDLEGIVFDPTEMTSWRKYVQAVQAQPNVKSLQLINCPPTFLENAVRPEDLKDKVKIRTFALWYDCPHCETTAAHLVDVAENLEQLVKGIAPTSRCPTCKSSLVAAVSIDQDILLRALPARDRDAALDKFLTTARGEPADKMENCLVARPEKPAPAPRTGRSLYVALSLGAILLGSMAAVVGWLWKERGETRQVPNNPTIIVEKPQRPTFTRPDWIMSDVPSSAFCHDMINRLMCVGVSSYRATRDDAVVEANDAALEELVSAVGLKISDPFFRENIVPRYSEARAKALSALQAADLDRDSDPKAAAAFTAAADVVRKGRKRVVEILQSSGGAAVPTQRTDWYWEEYAKKDKAKGNEVLVFVRYDVTLDAVRALVDKYSTTTPVMGSSAMTGFPALAWEQADYAGGAMFTKVAKPFATAGLKPQNVVVAVGEMRVSDANDFAKRVEEAMKTPGDLALTVKTGSDAGQVIHVRH
ncbi:MAG: uncharacterized protein JWO36_669 [Myxococcales bacterium]|nr:uncharacterized protein [Myxococcales bacterium]